MRTSIIGYPRVGSLRELKFATEKYFRKEISAEELKIRQRKSENHSGCSKRIQDWILFRQMIFHSTTICWIRRFYLI